LCNLSLGEMYGDLFGRGHLTIDTLGLLVMEDEEGGNGDDGLSSNERWIQILPSEELASAFGVDEDIDGLKVILRGYITFFPESIAAEGDTSDVWNANI